MQKNTSQFLIRLPTELRKQLRMSAAKNDMSMNQYLNAIIAQNLKNQDIPRKTN